MHDMSNCFTFFFYLSQHYMLNYLCKCDWTNIIIRKWFIRKILTLLHILIKNTVHTKICCIIYYHRNSIQGISERELSNGESKLGIQCMRCCSRWVWVFFKFALLLYILLYIATHFHRNVFYLPIVVLYVFYKYTTIINCWKDTSIFFFKAILLVNCCNYYSCYKKYVFI